MTDKRKVHDILSESDGHGNQRRPVAFIQHGNAEDGNTYEGICPWCGETICYVPSAVAKSAIGGIYRTLLAQQKIHWTSCKSIPSKLSTDPKQFAVEITTVPLNTEKPLNFLDTGVYDERQH